jgi:integrase
VDQPGWVLPLSMSSGAPLAEIANQLGHADVNVTANYLGRTGTPTRAASVMVLPTAPPLLKAV